MTPEEEKAWAEKYYTCPNPEHVECLGPTGTWSPFPCDSCGQQTHADTCWQTVRHQRRRVPFKTPVLCQQCSGQEALW